MAADDPSTSAPLAGLRVVEITSIYSGPMAGMMLAELGAEVIKVEAPNGTDPVRAAGLGGGPDSVNSVFYSLNRGKRFAAIDGKSDRGRELLADLVAGADIFLHNMRPGRPEDLGIGYAEMAARNPRLIYGAISGFGNDGPEAHLPAYDYVVQAKLGMPDYERDLATGRSSLVSQVIVDKTSACALVQGILAALYLRERTGRGQRIDIPMVAAGLAFFWPDGMAPVHAELEPILPLDSLPPWITSAPGSYLVVLPTADGEIATGILLPPWDGLCLALDRPDWAADERFADQLNRVLNLPALIDEVAAEVAKHTTGEVLERFARFDFAAGRVAARAGIENDPTIKHLGLISEQEARGVGRVRQPGPMWRFSDAATVTTTSVGTTGSETREILTEMGLSDDEVEALLADGTVYIAPAG